MSRMFHALRTWFRGTPVRRSSPPRRSTLAVEALEDRVVPATTDWRSVIGLDAAQSAYSYRGAGYSVAVLDTGIDYNNTNLGGGFGAGRRVVAGWDFVNNDADPMDDHGHGTHLAGIIGSANPNSPGVNPNVNLIALKVLDSTNNGNWVNVDKALQWVIAHQAEYNIVAVNLSLGSSNYTINPYTLLEADFTALKNLGVFTAAAAGNRFFTYNSQPGIGYPSISPNVVSVGATWAGDFGSAQFSTGAADYTTAADRIVSMGQRSANLDIMAPGAWITSTGLNNTTKSMAGTSMATAVVSGAASLIHEAYDKTGQSALATQENILKVMQATGLNVVDGDDENDNVINTGLSFKRLNLKAALDSIGQPNQAPTFAAIADKTLPAGQWIHVPLSVSDADKDPLAFSARVVYLPAQAFNLDQQYKFTSDGNYYTNNSGASEKWVYSSAEKTWYWLMPNGDLRRYANSTANTLQAANLVSTLDASYYADPRKLWNASYAGYPSIAFEFKGSSLSIQSVSAWIGTFGVEVTATDGNYTVKRSFNVTEVPASQPVVAVNTPPSLAVIADQSLSRGKDALVNLSATDADGNAISFGARVLTSGAPISVSVQGSQVTVKSQQAIGTFAIEVSASDGMATVTRSFNVTFTNAGPTLSEVPAVSMAKGQTSLPVTFVASDTDNDKLTYQAAVRTPDAAAYQLKQQYGLTMYGTSYFTNLWGASEKWLLGKNNQWYLLLPTGKLQKWAGNITETLKAVNNVGTVDPSMYVEPRLLWDAKPPVTPAITLSFVGNQLTIQRPAGLTGVFFIDVTVSDGWTTAKRMVQVTLN